MPATGHVSARIKAGASSIKVRIPDGVAARVRGTMGVGVLNFNRDRFPSQGGIHQSPDFETAANRIELNVEAGAASVDII
jgi:hypothetical protein